MNCSSCLCGLHRRAGAARLRLGSTIFRSPTTGSIKTFVLHFAPGEAMAVVAVAVSAIGPARQISVSPQLPFALMCCVRGSVSLPLLVHGSVFQCTRH